MDIDRLILCCRLNVHHPSFGSLMDIDRLILPNCTCYAYGRFGSLMDIDRLRTYPKIIFDEQG